MMSKTSLDDEETYLTQIILPGSICETSMVFLDAAQKKYIKVLLALSQELQRIILTVSEAHVALAKLGWWQEELINCYQGKPRHPLTILLADILAQVPITLADWQRLCIHLQDLIIRRGCTLREHFTSFYSILPLITKHIFGYADTETETFMSEYQYRYGLLNTILLHQLYERMQLLEIFDDTANLQFVHGAKRCLLLHQSYKGLSSLPKLHTDYSSQRFHLIHLALLSVVVNDFAKRNFAGKIDLPTPFQMFTVIFRHLL